MKFIEVTDLKGKRNYISINQIIKIKEYTLLKTTIFLTREKPILTVKMSYEDLIRLIND